MYTSKNIGNELSFVGKKISFNLIWIVVSIFTIIDIWAYGHNYWIYVFASIFLMIFAYGLILKKFFTKSGNLDIVFLLCIVFNVLLGLVNKDIIGSLMVNTSLAMIIAIGELDIEYEKYEEGILRTSIIVLVVSILLLITRNTWNLNSLAILIFCNSSIGLIWFKVSQSIKQKVVAFIYLVILSQMLFITQARNAAIVIVICFLLLLVPDKVLRKKFAFRALYVLAILSTIFAIPIMRFAFSNEKTLGFLLDFTTKVSDKDYGMSSHLDILLRVQKEFNSLSLLEKMFGQGVKIQHCHNIFYQTLFFYGYFGTTILYGVYIYIFETGYRLFVENNDRLALGCCIVLLGHFFMQVGETYMHGSETVMISALLPVAIIINLNRKSKNEKNSSCNIDRKTVL